jgi:membrane associated rhomboid family serine protease
MASVYRLNTFPLVHLGFFHALFNVLALTPLLERFEAEHGTLTTLAMFAGRACAKVRTTQYNLTMSYSICDSPSRAVHIR